MIGGRFLVLFYVLSVSWVGAASAWHSDLRLVLEVRDKIHREYVDKVDSLRVIDAGLDGLVTALDAGDNIYRSPSELGLERASLDDRAQVELLAEALQEVQGQYLLSVSPDSLQRGVVRGMLSGLDPHSNYLSAAEYADMAETYRGDFEGIGIYFEVRRGRLLVIAPIVGSPSYGKLRAGDHIVAIEGVPTDGISTEEVVEKLRGPRGSPVRLGVLRQGRDALLDFVVRRERIELKSLPYAFMLAGGTGYVRIVRFAETTAAELGRALAALRLQGMKRLLLDLRDNGGGLLQQAVEVADYFVDSGSLIVYTEGREFDSRHEYRARRPFWGEGEPLPLVVLIDHGSASASEIVAGAVQDLDLGLVAGQTSFGKGLVQGQFPLRSNGGLLLLTVARYYTPLGRLIQRPYTDDIQAYIQAGVDDVDPNSIDSLRAGKEIFYTASSRAVYGGGGITPDVLLRVEEYSDFAIDLFSSGAIADFSGVWVGGRGDWQQDFAEYRTGYEVPEEGFAAFAAFLRDEGWEVGAEDFSAHRDFLYRELKAGFARVLWGDEQYYRVRLDGDGEVEQSLGLFGEASALLARRTGAGY